MRSSVRAVLVDRHVAQALLGGVKFYPGLGVFDYGYFTADRVAKSHQHLLPKCCYVQAYNPAVHILRRGLNETSVFTWLLLGGDSCRESRMASLRPIGNCAAQLIAAYRAFLRDAVRGLGVRFECVVSGDTSCEVLSLMATYGTRMSEFCVTNGLLVCSTKDWPYYVNSLMLNTLSQLVDVVEKLQTANFHNHLLATVYDAELMLRFWAFGEARFLDHKRVSAIFPCRQLAPGSRKKSRRDDDGFVRFVPSLAGNFNRVMPGEIFGHVPVGPFVRVILAEVFSSLTVDLLCCPAEEAAEWWLTTAARMVDVECGMSTPASSATAFTIKRLVVEYGRRSVTSLGSLNISGTVKYATVLDAFQRPNVYRLAILYTLVSRRSDLADVLINLECLINRYVEVIPVVLLMANSHRQLSDWRYVAEIDPRSKRVTQTRAELHEAGAPQSLVRLC
ncbi:unnamed protein product [Macrosiphum euphorbiae]|uniref:Uncharacterized protein n=1 Tax=Macrosiphum euphorbiae TaxID=13131 RepID=A0AAV0Y8I6_9HEMI|nr:unnamed protein product [Macrosiphum euphorbiae]